MSKNVLKVGMREFRANLQDYISAASPIAITRHGETLGYYIPTHQKPAKAELEALKKAAAQLDKILVSHGINEDEAIEEFRALRASKKS